MLGVIKQTRSTERTSATEIKTTIFFSTIKQELREIQRCRSVWTHKRRGALYFFFSFYIFRRQHQNTRGKCLSQFFFFLLILKYQRILLVCEKNKLMLSHILPSPSHPHPTWTMVVGHDGWIELFLLFIIIIPPLSLSHPSLCTVDYDQISQILETTRATQTESVDAHFFSPLLPSRNSCVCCFLLIFDLFFFIL